MEYKDIAQLMESSLQDRMSRGFDKNQDNIPVDNKIEPERPKILSPNKNLSVPKKLEPTEPKIIRGDNNFPNSPLRNNEGVFPEGNRPAQKMRLFDPAKRLHQRRHFLSENDRLGSDLSQVDYEFDNLMQEEDPDVWGQESEEYFYDKIVPDLDDAFHDLRGGGSEFIDDKTEELMSQGMDEDEANSQANDFFDGLRGDNESYFGRYQGMRNYGDVNNFLRHGMPDDTEFPLDGTLYELGWGNGPGSSWYETEEDYPYYDDGKDYETEDEWEDAKEAYENQVAPRKSYAIAALVHMIKKMENHIDGQEEMPGEQLYRGLHTSTLDTNLDSDPFKDLNIGDIIRDPGFMSTSRDRKTAEGFSNGILMDIFGGGKYKDLSKGEESELVFPPLTQLKYLGKGDDNSYKFDQVGFDRNNIQESVKLTKPKISKIMKKLSDEFRQRMNDFQFEVLKPEKEEEKPQPKQFRDFAKKYFDFDD